MATRRQFIERSAAAVAAVAVAPSILTSCGESSNKTSAAPVEEGKPCSKFNGVQIGAITYSWRDMPGGLENVIKYCKEANVSSIELMSGDLEEYLGVPTDPTFSFIMAHVKDNPGTPFVPTPEQAAQIEAAQAAAKEVRLNMDMSKVAAAKKLLDDNGIDVHIVKFSPAKWSDEEIRYAFKVAKAMGAGAVTEELSQEAAERLAPFAAEAGVAIAFHNHMQYAEEGFSCDPMLALDPHVMLNFDAGHYAGSTGKDPVAFIEKYHDRIYSVHIKDKTGPNTTPANTNQVWGQGETDLEGILNCLKNKYPEIYADIELEYPINNWSNGVKETGICVKYARQILL